VPTVLRERGYRFFFFMADGFEPPHIHVAKEDRAAKFWLDPVELATNDGMRSHELGEIREIITARLATLRTAWFGRFGRL
jgi:hypothetical protein